MSFCPLSLRVEYGNPSLLHFVSIKVFIRIEVGHYFESFHLLFKYFCKFLKLLIMFTNRDETYEKFKYIGKTPKQTLSYLPVRTIF